LIDVMLEMQMSEVLDKVQLDTFVLLGQTPVPGRKVDLRH